TRDEVISQIEALSPAERAEVSPEWLARLKATPEGDPWSFSYAVVVRDSGESVGCCAFKGPPNNEGIVEVAYGIQPIHQRKGYATEACQALVAFAFRSGLVRIVCAHTKSGNIASERTLIKSGFERIGDVIDPEDGLVCRWEIKHHS